MPTGYGPTAVESAVAGYEAMGRITQDVASSDILKQAYSGTSPESVAKDPMEQQAVLQKASVLAGQKGLASLAHSFQKDASSITENVQKEQIKDIKIKQDRLEYAGQMLSGLPDNASMEDFNRVFAGIKDETAQMTIQSITRNPNIPPEKKKELLGNLTKTVKENLEAAKIAALGEYREKQLNLREREVLLKERKGAGGQGNVKPAREASAGAIKRQSATLKDELGDVLVKDRSGDLIPMSDSQRATVASRIENEGRQRYKNNPSAYSSVQEAVDEAKDDIVATDFPETTTKSTFLGMEVPFTSSKEKVYKPGGAKAAAKETKSAKDKYNAEQETWISRAMQANPGMSREEIVNEGKKLKKL
jgi:hypothetical protein